MNKLSTGQKATLGNYRKLAAAAFGEDSEAVKYLDVKIAEAKKGAEEEVIAVESQVIYLLTSLHFGEDK